MNALKLLIGLCLAAIALPGCTEESKELTPEEKYAVDTIFNRQINQYHNYLDSFCKSHRDSFYRVAFDSIKKERLAEIEMFIYETDSLP